MDRNISLTFRPVREGDRELVHGWLGKPHAAEWFYGEGLKRTIEGVDRFIQGSSDAGYWLGCDEGRPFVFLITSIVKKPEGELSKWSRVEGATITLDILIGEETYMGKKLSPFVIKDFLLRKFPDVEEVLIDPEASNLRAVHVYQKIGFKIIGEFIPSHSPHPHYMMRLDMKELKQTSEENPLGFPLTYSALSGYYDLLSQGGEESTHQAIDQILREHQVKTVLDLTCGTGTQVLWLTEKGYEVVGSDLSPEMLEIASKKAEEKGMDLSFHQGDMRTVQLGQFDAAITIFNAIGHLTKPDFEKALKNIGRNLKPGGIYLFDIFNLEAMTDEAVKNLEMNIKEKYNHFSIRLNQRSELDRSSGRLTSHDDFSIQEGEKDPVTIQGAFHLQLYTAEELRETLARNGFKTLGQHSLDGSPFSRWHSERILTVSQYSAE